MLINVCLSAFVFLHNNKTLYQQLKETKIVPENAFNFLNEVKKKIPDVKVNKVLPHSKWNSDVNLYVSIKYNKLKVKNHLFI